MLRDTSQDIGQGPVRQRQIESVLSKIRPVLQADGVRVELLDVRDDGASVSMTGLRPA